MKIDAEVIRHVAAIARLKLTDKEIEEFMPQLQEGLEYFSKLSKVNTDNINPSFHPILLRDAMREDKKEECLSQDDALANTQNKKDGYFKGPRVI